MYLVVTLFTCLCCLIISILAFVSIRLGKSFFFRGCGWPSTKPKPASFVEDKAWITTVNKLMDILFGKDYLGYHYDQSKVCFVTVEDSPDSNGNHDEWEDDYYQTVNCTPMSPQSPSVKKKAGKIMSGMQTRSVNLRKDAFFLLPNQIPVHCHLE